MTPTRRQRTLQAWTAMFFASFGYVALRVLLTPIRIKTLTHLLEKEAYGTLTLVALSISFLSLVFSFGSLEFLIRRLPGRERTYQLGAFKSVAVYFGGLYGSLAVGLAFAFAWWKPEKVLLDGGDYALIAGILVLTAHILQRVYFLFGLRRYPQARFLQVLYADMMVVPLLAFLWVGQLDIRAVLLVWLAWLAVPLLISHRWACIGDVAAAPLERAHLRDVLTFGLPLLPMTLGEWLFQLADKVLLLHFQDATAIANYGLCINIAMVGFLAGTSLLDIFSTEFFKLVNESESHGVRELSTIPALRGMFTLMTRFIFLVSIPIAAALFIFGEHILLVLSNQNYVDAAFIFPWTAAIPMLFLMAYIFGRVMMAANKAARLGGATLLAAALNVGLNYTLIPLLREPGAALSTIISMSFLVMYIGYSIRFFYWLDWHELRLVRLLIFAGVCVAGFLAIAQWLPGQNLLPLILGGLWALLAMGLLGLITRTDLAPIMGAFHSKS